jgi:DNA-binding MarR family transcriptional regulator
MAVLKLYRRLEEVNGEPLEIREPADDYRLTLVPRPKAASRHLVTIPATYPMACRTASGLMSLIQARVLAELQDRGGHCTGKAMAKAVGRSVRTTKRVRRALAAKGLVTREQWAVGASRGAWGGSQSLATVNLSAAGDFLRVDGRLPIVQGLVLAAIQYRLRRNATWGIDYSWLERKVGRSRRTVQQAVHWLSTNGYIVTKQTRANGRRAVVVWDINVPVKPAESGPSVKPAENGPSYDGRIQLGSSGGVPPSELNPEKRLNESGPGVPAPLDPPFSQLGRKEPSSATEVVAEWSALILDEGTRFLARAYATVEYEDPVRAAELGELIRSGEVRLQPVDLSLPREQAYLDSLFKRCRSHCKRVFEAGGEEVAPVDLLRSILGEVYELATATGTVTVLTAGAAASRFIREMRATVYYSLLKFNGGRLSLHSLTRLRGGTKLVDALAEAILTPKAFPFEEFSKPT